MCATTALTLHRWSQESGGKAVSEHPDALLAEAFAVSQNALPSPSAEAFAKAVARRQVTLNGSSSAADRYEKALSQRDAAGFTQRPLWQRKLRSKQTPPHGRYSRTR